MHRIEKPQDRRAIIRAMLHLKIQVPVGRHRADRRHVIVREMVVQYRRFTPWSPGLPHTGQEIDHRIHPRTGSCVGRGWLFFNAGQRSCAQRWMAASSRCAARRTGCWRVQFTWCNRRRTCRSQSVTSKLPRNQRRHAGAGPDIAIEPVGFRALREQRHQRVPLCRREFHRAPRTLPGAERLGASGRAGEPETHCRLGHA